MFSVGPQVVSHLEEINVTEIQQLAALPVWSPFPDKLEICSPIQGGLLRSVVFRNIPKLKKKFRNICNIPK